MVQQTKYHTWEICRHILSSWKSAQDLSPPQTSWGTGRAQLDQHLGFPACPCGIILPQVSFCNILRPGRSLPSSLGCALASLWPRDGISAVLSMVEEQNPADTNVKCMSISESHAPCPELREEGLTSHMQENNILTLVCRSLQGLQLKANIYPTPVTDRLGLELFHLNQINTKHFAF